MTERLRKDAKKIKRFKKSSIVFPIVGGVVLAGGAAVGITYGLMNLPIVSVETGTVVVEESSSTTGSLTFDFKDQIYENEVKASIINQTNSNDEDQPVIVFANGEPTGKLYVKQSKGVADLRLEHAPLDEGSYIFKFDMKLSYKKLNGGSVTKTIKNLEWKYSLEHDILEITDPTVTQETVTIDDQGRGESTQGFTFGYSGELENPAQLTIEINSGFDKDNVRPYIASIDKDKKTFVVKFDLKNISAQWGSAEVVLNGKIDILYNLNVIHTSTDLSITAVEGDYLIEPTDFYERVRRQYLLNEGDQEGKWQYQTNFTLEFKGTWASKIASVDNTFATAPSLYTIKTSHYYNIYTKKITVYVNLELVHNDSDPSVLQTVKDKLNEGTALETTFTFRDTNGVALKSTTQSYHYTLGDTDQDYIAVDPSNPYYAEIHNYGTYLAPDFRATITRKWYYFGFDEKSQSPLDIQDIELDKNCYEVIGKPLPTGSSVTVTVDKNSINEQEQSFETKTVWSGFDTSEILAPGSEFGEVQLILHKFKFGETYFDVRDEGGSDLSFDAHWKNNVTIPTSKMTTEVVGPDANNEVQFKTSIPVTGFDTESIRKWLKVTAVKNDDKTKNLKLVSDVKYTYVPDIDPITNKPYFDRGRLDLIVTATVETPGETAHLNCGLVFNFRPEDGKHDIPSQKWEVPSTVGIDEDVQAVIAPSINDSHVTDFKGSKLECVDGTWSLNIPSTAGKCFSYDGLTADEFKNVTADVRVKTDTYKILNTAKISTPVNKEFGLNVDFSISGPQPTDDLTVEFEISFNYNGKEIGRSQGWKVTFAKPEVVVTIDDTDVTKEDTVTIAKKPTGDKFEIETGFYGYKISPDTISWTDLNVSFVGLDSEIKNPSIEPKVFEDEGNTVIVSIPLVPNTSKFIPTQIGDKKEIAFGIKVEYNGKVLLDGSTTYKIIIDWHDATGELTVNDKNVPDADKDITVPGLAIGDTYTFDKTFSGYEILWKGEVGDEYWDKDAGLSAKVSCSTGMQDDTATIVRNASGNGIRVIATFDGPTSEGISKVHNYTITLYYNGSEFTNFSYKLTLSPAA
ncbi:MAG: hypothetical protein ACOQNY_02640 [Mycoplasmoidaceae bacterium]